MEKQLLHRLFIIVICGLANLAQGQNQNPGFDLLMDKKMTLFTNNLALVLNKTESDIKVFADSYTVRLDKGSKITTPKKVIGSIMQPVMTVSVKKCVLFFCQTINLDAEFNLVKLTGSPGMTCSENYKLIVRLNRSSEMLTNLYDRFESNICFMNNSKGADVRLQVAVIHAASYSTGIVQKQAFELIRIQSDSILESFIKVMKLNGATDVNVL